MFHIKCVWDGEGKLHCGSNDDSLRYWLSNNFSRVVIVRLVNNPQSWVRNIAWRIEKHMFTALIHGMCQQANTHEARALFREVVCWNTPSDEAVILKTYSLWLIYDIVSVQHTWLYWVVAYLTDSAVLHNKIRNAIQGNSVANSCNQKNFCHNKDANVTNNVPVEMQQWFSLCVVVEHMSFSTM